MIISYDEETYDACLDAFQALPLAAIVNGQYLALHGGISSWLTKVEDINTLERIDEPGKEENLFNDILWSDPMPSRDAMR